MDCFLMGCTAVQLELRREEEKKRGQEEGNRQQKGIFEGREDRGGSLWDPYRCSGVNHASLLVRGSWGVTMML